MQNQHSFIRNELLVWIYFVDNMDIWILIKLWNLVINKEVKAISIKEFICQSTKMHFKSLQNTLMTDHLQIKIYKDMLIFSNAVISLMNNFFHLCIFTKYSVVSKSLFFNLMLILWDSKLRLMIQVITVW